MVVDIAEQELSPGVTAISFTRRLVLGNRAGWRTATLCESRCV